jgi:hypothetical protein
MVGDIWFNSRHMDEAAVPRELPAPGDIMDEPMLGGVHGCLEEIIAWWDASL